MIDFPLPADKSYITGSPQFTSQHTLKLFPYLNNAEDKQNDPAHS